jgi:hypothetical protein
VEKNDLEALKLLADWAKWLVAVQTGVLAAIGTFLKPEGIAKLGGYSKGMLSLTVALFTISILAASYLLKSLPATAQRLPPPGTDDIFLMGTYEGTKGARVSKVTTVATYAFIAGLVCFTLSIIATIWLGT